MIANIEVKFKNNSEHFKLLIYEKSRTLNTSTLQDKQNERSRCIIWTAGLNLGYSWVLQNWIQQERVKTC